MGQKNLKRTQFVPREEVHTPANDDIQLLAFTGYFEFADVVDVIDVDAFGNVISVLADNLTVQAIDPNVSLTLSAVVDTTAAVGTPMIRCQAIDDGQDAVDRLYRRKLKGNMQFVLRQNVIDQALNTPSAGKGQYDVEDVSFLRAGDTVDLLADEGIIQTGLTIESINPNADDVNNPATVVLDSSVDTSTFTNPFILATSITVQEAIERNQERIDGIDTPMEGEYMGAGDKDHIAFIAANLFVQDTTKLLIDGKRLRRGEAGDRASLEQGTYPGSNDALKFTSNVLGLDGNSVKVALVSGAGFTIAVSGNYPNFTISINDNGGAATAEEIADALNADAEAKRLIQAQFGGDGTGVPSTFAAANLTGGLDNGTGDYAELEQVFENKIVNTGYKIVALWILPNERNRLNSPPKDDEEMVIDYRKATENVNR